MKIEDDHEVGESEQVTRFVCGALLGLLVGLGVIVATEWTSPLQILLILLVAMFGCGMAALIDGDRFWYGLFGADWRPPVSRQSRPIVLAPRGMNMAGGGCARGPMFAGPCWPIN